IAQTKQERISWLTSSIGEFDYVIRNAKPDFVLLPEILTKRGENLVDIGRVSDGVGSLVRAIELKRDYWPAYVILSDYYEGVKDNAKALLWIERGLAAAPQAEPLKRRWQSLSKSSSGKSD